MESKIHIKDQKDFARVFKAIKEMATLSGMGTLRQTQLMTASSELLTNIIKYARQGEVRVSVSEINGRKKVIIEAIDHGPGIENIDLAMTRGYSTKKTLGIGLPGAKNLTDEFKIDTTLGKGTTITIAKWV